MYIMIATIRYKNNKIKYIRLLDVDSQRTVDIAYNEVFKLLDNSPNSILNLRVADGKLMSYNGLLDRYPSIGDGMVWVGRAPLVILGRAGDNTFLCSDYKGVVKNLTSEQIIECDKIQGIANGKIVGNNISAIEGNYIYIYKQKRIMLLKRVS